MCPRRRSGPGPVRFMKELFVKYTDESGADERVQVEGDKFIIGRHSLNDLSIADARLSRRHLKIERFAEVFVASDLGSSNGSTLNGAVLSEPIALSDGDILDLGGVTLEVEIASDEPSSKADSETGPEKPDPAAAPAAAGAPGGTTASIKDSSMFGNPFIVAPLMGIAMLMILGFGILIYTLVAGEDDSKTIADSDLSTPEDVFPGSTPEVTPEQSPGAIDTSGPPLETPGGTEPGTTPEQGNGAAGDLDREERLRGFVTGFLRSIAQRDPNPVITSEPLQLIGSRVDRFRGSSAVAANIDSAVKSSAQLTALARSKNLKPEFVAAAALAKLGDRRGDVLQTAGGMIDILGNLKIQIGDAFANECVIIIAAYDQGEAGQFLAMRDTMTKLATDNPNVSSRKVRTVWYLKEQGKLNDAQFELALRFLAIGTIAQDPQNFGLSSRPLRFN